MNLRSFAKWLIVTVMQVMLISACSAEEPFSLKDVKGFYMPSTMEELYGTWVNAEYEGNTTKDAKFIIHDWGFMESYTQLAQGSTIDTGVITIIKKWRSNDESLWYITFYRGAHGGDGLGIHKISENGAVMELFWVAANVGGNQETLVEKNLTPRHPHYRIYRRQTSSQ